MLRQLDATEADTQLYGRLAEQRPLREPGAARAAQRDRAQPPRAVGAVGLRHLRRSADRAAAHRATSRSIELVRQLVQAHAYWRLKGLAVDLVIWNEDPSGYRQVLQDEIMGVIASRAEASLLDRPGGIFVRRSEQMSEEDKVLMQTVARRDRQRHRRHARRAGRAPRRASSCRRRCSRPRAPRSPAATAAGRRRRGRAARPGRVQRPRRLHARRPRVRHHHHARRAHAGAVGQRARQPVLRHGRQRERRRVHLVRERARLPADAVAQRSGRRRQRRGVLRPRRGRRPVLVADAAAGRRRRRRTRRATASATASSSTPRTASRPSCGRTSRPTRR